MRCKYGTLEIVEALLEAGADKEQKNSGGETALIAAANVGRKEIVELLLKEEEPSDKTATNNDGKTALDLASENGHADIVELLEAGGAAAAPTASSEGAV